MERKRDREGEREQGTRDRGKKERHERKNKGREGGRCLIVLFFKLETKH
jgi:hypothetical protein